MHVPTDLTAALTPEALHYFESLPELQQQSFVLGIEEADGRAARRQRIQRATARLAGISPARSRA
jgi:hypothetical protein